MWGSSAILIVATAVLGLAIRRLDIRELDAALETKARTLATLVFREGRTIEVDFAGEFMPEFETAEEPEYFQLRLSDGSLIERSDLLGERDLPFIEHAQGEPIFMNLRLPDGRHGRFVQISFPPRSDGGEETTQDTGQFRIPDHTHPNSVSVVLGVARSREELDSLLLTVYLTLAGVDILLVGLIAFVVHLSVRKGFGPVVDLNAQVASLDPNTLTKRIHLPNAPAEIETIPAAVNRFIDALEAVFARERRFTSDVAHELRTPVAEFRAACEVGAKWSDDPALVKRRFENLKESAMNMERLLNSLLELSRIETGAMDIRPTETRIASLVDSCWTRICSDGIESESRLTNRIDQSLTLNTDAVKLEMIIHNLLNNAASYSLSGSSVTCTSKEAPNGAREICISNHTNEIAREDLAHMFERFWRKDAARTGGHHSGLGLSIVKVLADALGIRITADMAPDNVFTVSLLFPSQVSR